ncbi:MAG: zinc ribbon domain-containing protein [Kofleriaceae bacterium]
MLTASSACASCRCSRSNPMPTYEYRCNACGRESEVQQRMSDPDLVHCEACGKDELERLISRTAFALKGSGWYKDLYSSTKPEKPAAASSEGSGSGGDKPATPAATSSDSSTSSTTPSASTPAPSTSSSTPSSSTPSGGGSSGGGSSGGGSSGGGSSGGTKGSST